MSVTDLEVRFADETPTKNPEESFTPEVAFSSCSSEVICQGCKKRLKIQETDSGQLKKQEKSLYCPVCSHFIHSTRCSNLDIYVVKALQGSMALARMVLR
jgi:hypothetical protein